MSLPHKIYASGQAVQKRWQRQIEIFRTKIWPGARDTSEKPIHVSKNKCKNGKTYFKSRYSCRACSRTFPQMKSPPQCVRPGKVPPLKKRQALWKACRQQAAAEVTTFGQKRKPKQKSLSKVADGAQATRRGLRAQRVGEAARPGPGSQTSRDSSEVDSNGASPSSKIQTKDINILTFNIGSIHRHLSEVLRTAEAHEAPLVCIQESPSRWDPSIHEHLPP